MEFNSGIIRSSKQSLLIRIYKTTLKEFILYPTVNYAKKDNYLESFRKEHQSFVEKKCSTKKGGR